MKPQAAPPSLQDVVDFAFDMLARVGLVASGLPPGLWTRFAKTQSVIERHFEVPWTTITPLMRRFLFAVGAAAQPARMVGAGTYVGFAFAWLAAGSALGRQNGNLQHAIGLDIDAEATALARTNSVYLGLGSKLRFETADAIAWLSTARDPMDLLYIDVDSPRMRKAEYLDVLRAARPRLAPGALILAHDACVPLFDADFANYHAEIERDPELIGPQVMPLDECGISLCRMAP